MLLSMIALALLNCSISFAAPQPMLNLLDAGKKKKAKPDSVKMPPIGSCQDNNIVLSSLFGRDVTCANPMVKSVFCGQDAEAAAVFAMPPFVATIFTNVCRKSCNHGCNAHEGAAEYNQDDAAEAMAQQLGVFDTCPGVTGPRKAVADPMIPEEKRLDYTAGLKSQEHCTCQNWLEMVQSKEKLCAYSFQTGMRDIYLGWSCSGLCMAAPLPSSVTNLIVASSPREDEDAPQGSEHSQFDTSGSFESMAWILASNSTSSKPDQ